MVPRSLLTRDSAWLVADLRRCRLNKGQVCTYDACILTGLDQHDCLGRGVTCHLTHFEKSWLVNSATAG